MENLTTTTRFPRQTGNLLIDIACGNQECDVCEDRVFMVYEIFILVNKNMPSIEGQPKLSLCPFCLQVGFKDALNHAFSCNPVL